MSAAQFEAVIRSGVAEGWLREPDCTIEQDSRPWPIVLLTALGAWLAAIPLIGVVAITLGNAVRDNVGVYVVGALVLAGTVAVLRSASIPLFFEQLAVPGLLVGGCTLGFGLFRDMPAQGAATAMAVLSLGVAAFIPRPWLRVLLGAAASTMLAIAFVPRDWFSGSERVSTAFWWAWHSVAALTMLGAVAQWRLSSSGTGSRLAAAIDSVVAGSVLAVLAALSWWSGMAFLVGASMQVHDTTAGVTRLQSGELVVLATVSATLALACMAWLARHWPSVRKPWCAGVAIVLIALAWAMPALGAVLLTLTLCAVARRWRLAGAAAVAAAWIISSFYYGLEWPLATKALVLFGAGTCLGALAWFASRGGLLAPSPGVGAIQAAARHTRAGVALTLLAVLVVANVGIWQKEQLANSAGTVFVEMAPRDPRSLMQGDYMRLEFRLPLEVQSALANVDPSAQPRVVAKRDSRGVATVMRLDDGAPKAGDEFVIDLAFKDGRWLFVTDAWYFKEGEAQRWAGARFGEFKVDSNGRAMLVGLRGAKFEPL